MLSITGDGMDSLLYTWPVDSMPLNPVVIRGVPAGNSRVFQGALTNSSGIVTYSGTNTTPINAGESVNVHLYLHLLDTAGDASVCIEIEGLPSQCSNDTIDTVPPIDTVLKCFHFDAMNYSYLVEGVQDTVLSSFSGDMSLSIAGSNVFGKLIVTGGENAGYEEIQLKGIVTVPVPKESFDTIGELYLYCNLHPVDTTVTKVQSLNFKQAIYSDGNFSSDINGIVILSVDTIDREVLFSGYQMACP